MVGRKSFRMNPLKPIYNCFLDLLASSPYPSGVASYPIYCDKWLLSLVVSVNHPIEMLQK
jgi:hypothetical protein